MNARRRGVPAPPPPPPAPDPAPAVQLYTLEVAAKRLAISVRNLRTQIAAGRVRAVRIGSGLRISEAELHRVVVEGASA